MMINGIVFVIWAMMTAVAGIVSYAAGKNDGRDEAYDEVDRELRKRRVI